MYFITTVLLELATVVPSLIVFGLTPKTARFLTAAVLGVDLRPIGSDRCFLHPRH